jgi:hypothetical protein
MLRSTWLTKVLGNTELGVQVAPCVTWICHSACLLGTSGSTQSHCSEERQLISKLLFLTYADTREIPEIWQAITVRTQQIRNKLGGYSVEVADRLSFSHSPTSLCVLGKNLLSVPDPTVAGAGGDQNTVAAAS